MTNRTDQLEERVEVLERAVLRLLANVSAAGALLGALHRDDEEGEGR